MVLDSGSVLGATQAAQVRLRGIGTMDEDIDVRDHQQRRQIPLYRQEICPKNRSHP